MKREEHPVISATWHAADLEEHEGCSELTLLSIHDHVINFQVTAWHNLLMVAGPDLEKGPSVIGLSESDFKLFSRQVKNEPDGFFGTSVLLTGPAERSIRLNWRSGRSCSFTAPRVLEHDLNKMRLAVGIYRALLKQSGINTESAVLLQLAGGDQYFRQKIRDIFPVLVDSLLEKDKSKFIDCCRNLIGMGRGSSPTGDDLIHGALAACHSFAAETAFLDEIAEEFHEAAQKTNRMGRHMLETGRKGLTPEIVRLFICSVAEGSPDRLILQRLLKIGSGTGADLAFAILCYIRKVADYTASGLEISNKEKQ
jgi:hypothetical protein